VIVIVREIERAVPFDEGHGTRSRTQGIQIYRTATDDRCSVGRITYAQEEVVFDRLGPQQMSELLKILK